MKELSRRDFLKLGGAGVATTVLASCGWRVTNEPGVQPTSTLTTTKEIAGTAVAEDRATRGLAIDTPRVEATKPASATAAAPRKDGTPVAAITARPAATVEATAESCPKGTWKVQDLRGKDIMGVTGMPTKVTKGLDLADHGIFENNLTGLKGPKNPTRNVLEADKAGAFLADPSKLTATDKVKWDAWVAAGDAEYIRREGKNRNFYEFQDPSDPALAQDAEGRPQFELTVPKHTIIRIDMEEIEEILLRSKNGDRNIGLQFCQSGAIAGEDFGHQTVFIRAPYEQEMKLTMRGMTVPGTEVQIFGMEVRAGSPTAFASTGAFLQGVKVRQEREAYPRYFVHTVNMNDLSIGSAESPKPNTPFQALKANY